MSEIRVPNGTHLAYSVTHEQYWWETLRSNSVAPNDNRPSVNVMASAKGQGGGVAWEFAVVEYDLGGQPALHLEMFDDSWRAFALMAPFFAALASGEVETLGDVRELLDRLGAVDETKREQVRS